MHLTQAIKERYHGYVLNNFIHSRYSKRLREFKNKYEGQSCFIIGNGPSLLSADLERILKRGIATFAFNKIYLIFDKTDWRPTFYISQDEKTLITCQKEVNELCLNNKFIPLSHKYYHDITIDNAYYFKLSNSDLIHYEFSDDISKYVGNSSTVAYSAAQFAVYMGFKKIYLLGIDHQFSRYKDSSGKLIIDNSVKDYFSDKYNDTNVDNLNTPNPDVSTRAFLAMKDYCDKHGIEVYNATRGGKLEVFQRVRFDEVIKTL